MEINLANLIADPKNWLAVVVSTPIACFALILALKNYLRKSGALIHGRYTLASSSSCDDSYISEIILENLKDRAITIYSIFLKVGHNYYIELENHEKNPLILKAYETYRASLGPIMFHSIGFNKINMKRLIEDKKTKKRLILSTSNGKYSVPKPTKIWNPTSVFFKNNFTGLVRPVVADHKGKKIGGNIRFIVDITQKSGETTTTLLKEDDYRVQIFEQFTLTETSLKSKNNLIQFFEKQKADGTIPQEIKFEIHDFNLHKNKMNERYSGDASEAASYSTFYYHIIGRTHTWLSNQKNKTKHHTKQ
jgi:hypothetical protein